MTLLNTNLSGVRFASRPRMRAPKIRQKILSFIVFIISNHSFALVERQMLSGSADKDFISSLPLSRYTKDQRFLNILILAQDDRNGHIPDYHTSAETIRSKPLGSRSDIIMLLSLDKNYHTGTIYSLYRDELAPTNCETNQGNPNQISNRKINEVYSQKGRKAFLNCVNEMLSERLLATQQGRALVEANNRIKIHVLLEGSKHLSLEPVAKESLKVVANSPLKFARIYGSKLTELIGLVNNSSEIKDALSSSEENSSIDIKTEDMHIGSLQRSLMDRHNQAAGGYQRAYNVARFIADLIGWVAKGLQTDPNIMLAFTDAYKAGISYSENMNVLDYYLKLIGNGQNAFIWLGVRNGFSPIQIIQFGAEIDSYIAGQDGYRKMRLSAANNHGILSAVKNKHLIPAAPNL